MPELTSQPVQPGFYTEGGYLSNHPSWHTEDAAWKASHILRMIRKNGLQPSSVCEIGCGAGEILNVLLAELPDTVRFTGYEISPQAFEMARKREKDRLQFFMNPLESVPANHGYDLGLMIDVFEHVEDFYGFLKTSRKTCRQMIFHIPLDLSVQSVMRAKPLLRKRERSGHIHYFTKETALASLRDSGYRVIDHFYTGSYTDRPARTALSRIANVPRRIFFSLNKDLTVRVLGGYSLMVLADCR